MRCQLELSGQDGERVVYRCPVCGREVRSSVADPAQLKAQCGPLVALPPTRGPGTEFFKVCKEVGVRQKPGCDCANLRRAMDEAGVEGCRRNRDCFLRKLRNNLECYTITEKAAAAWAVLWQGKPWSLDGMLELAIQRAEAALPAPGF
jgi:hypothetical protein